MIDSTKIIDGFRAVLAFLSAFEDAEKAYGQRAFCPSTADIHTPEIKAMREAGMRLHNLGGVEAMFSAACAMASHDPRRFFGLGVLLSVVWAGVGDWPPLRS